MKRPSYREAIMWIALNDEDASFDVEYMASMISVLLVADLFGKEPEEVANAVIKQRKQRS